MTRQEPHLRRIEKRGYARSDGRYEVEGRVVDTKAGDFTPPAAGRYVPANQPIHDRSRTIAPAAISMTDVACGGG